MCTLPVVIADHLPDKCSICYEPEVVATLLLPRQTYTAFHAAFCSKHYDAISNAVNELLKEHIGVS